MKPRCELRRYKKTGENVWSSSYQTYFLTDLQLSEGLEANRDMFRISIDNNKNKYTDAFNVDDRVVIYIYTGTSPTISDLLFDGLVIEVDFDFSLTGRILTVRGANRTNELLSNLVLETHIQNNKKVHEIIEDIINQVNNNNQSYEDTDIRKIKYDSTTIAQTKADGSSFENNTFIINYKSAYEAIRQFSGDEYTKDGAYIFWIDNENYFHWQPKKLVTYSNLDLVEGENIERLQIQKGTWGVYNALIVDVGKDAYNHGNHVLQINPVSIIEAGAKWNFLDRSSISAQLMNEIEKLNPSSFTKDADGSRTSNFPNAYPFTMPFPEIINGVQQVGSWVVDNNSEFNTAIRQEARRKGREEATNFLRRNGSIQYKGTITIQGSLNYEKGDVVKLTSPSAGLSEYELRIVDITQIYNSGGWDTQLQLEEDSE